MSLSRCRLYERMLSAIERFFRDPSRRSYLEARRIVVSQSQYAPNDLRLVELTQRAESGQFAVLLAQIESLDDHFALSPRIQFLGAVAATELGQTEKAESYRRQLTACLRGLRATGDGSRRRPFQVTFLSDERDLLKSLGKMPVTQRMEENGSRAFDILRCSDGTDVYFDVSCMIACRPTRQRTPAVGDRQGNSRRRRTPAKSPPRRITR